jgi:hypothetical protein
VAASSPAARCPIARPIISSVVRANDARPSPPTAAATTTDNNNNCNCNNGLLLLTLLTNQIQVGPRALARHAGGEAHFRVVEILDLLGESAKHLIGLWLLFFGNRRLLIVWSASLVDCVLGRPTVAGLMTIALCGRASAWRPSLPAASQSSATAGPQPKPQPKTMTASLSLDLRRMAIYSHLVGR